MMKFVSVCHKQGLNCAGSLLQHLLFEILSTLGYDTAKWRSSTLLLRSTAIKLDVKSHRSSVSRYQADCRESTIVNKPKNSEFESMHAAIDLLSGVSASEISCIMSSVALISIHSLTRKSKCFYRF